jgi:diguanylate cyclase (GGDEF)-like protein
MRVRRASDRHPLPAPLAALEDSRAGVAKAWLVRAIEAMPLDQVERLPVGRIAQDLPALVADIVRAVAAEPLSAGERVTLLDRLAALRGSDDAATGLVRDLGALQEAMLRSLERQAPALDAAESIALAARLAALFGDLQADAADRNARSSAPTDDLITGPDRLTGLHGQSFVREHLRHLVSMQKRYDQPFAVLLVDVDGLRRINQAHGEHAGDETLIGVAGAVERSVRTADTAARLEGDEFCVLLPQQTAGRARTVALRLAEAVEQVHDPAGGNLQIAIGVAASPQHATTADELLEQADSALFRAKAAGERVAVGAEAYEVDDE